MGSAEDRTFKANFSEEGVGKLRETVRDKLKEFMGDYTDDTLVEYVIVLIRNGRHKEEARTELNVFLADDSDSFVSWLWDHLSSNLDMYVHSEVVTQEKPGENEPHVRDSQSERGKSDGLSRSRHKREWKGLVREVTEVPPLLKSEVGTIISLGEKGQLRPTHEGSPSPLPPPHRKKRSRHEEQQPRKRDTSQQSIGAPRRLLQFAVRDAVGTVRQPGTAKVQDDVEAVRQTGTHSLRPASAIGGSMSVSGKEPSAKRLRSVVSTPTEDSSIPECGRRIQSIARVPNAMATVVRAVQEAADDVRKARSGRSVFDRLGRDIDLLETKEQVIESNRADVQDEDYEEYNQIGEQIYVHTNHLHADKYAGGVGNTEMIDTDAGFASPSASDGEGYDDVNVIGHKDIDVSHRGLRTGNGVQNTLISRLNIAIEDHNAIQISRNKEQDRPVSASISSLKMVNSSLSALSQKPSNSELTDVGEMVVQKSVQENDLEAKFGTQIFTENNSPTAIQNQIVKPATGILKESQKTVPPTPGSYTAGRPLEDADSRTIFVSNVHFAATKDSLSRHFNKFGEVLKVIIVTDAATGQPKGSAFVEFMRKEAADNALSLDGTSFMSRLLKVVKRSSAHQEATPPMTWPRVARGSAYASARFPRVPFPRGLSGGYRPRLPVKPGTRSMQWKRGDAQAASADSGALPSGHAIGSQTSRSLTYIRTESKPDGNVGTA